MAEKHHHITRIDIEPSVKYPKRHPTHGWQVRVRREGNRLSKFFADARNGGSCRHETQARKSPDSREKRAGFRQRRRRGDQEKGDQWQAIASDHIEDEHASRVGRSHQVEEPEPLSPVPRRQHTDEGERRDHAEVDEQV